MLLSVPPGYLKKMDNRVQTAAKGTLPLNNLDMVLNNCYLLPCAEPKSSGDDEIESDSLEALVDDQEEE